MKTPFTVIATTVTALFLLNTPAHAACKTCTPQAECVTTENAAFCSCEEKIWGQGQRCIPKTPICLATGACCCGGPGGDNTPPSESVDRDVRVSALVLRAVLDEHPHLGHALDSARASSDVTQRTDANTFGTAAWAHLTTGWHAGVVAGMAEVADFLFVLEMETEGDGAAFVVTIRRYDRETLTESLRDGTMVEVIEGTLGRDGIAAATTTDGVAGPLRSWTATSAFQVGRSSI